MFLAPRARTAPRRVSLESLRCGAYLTDGRRLFRVVSQFAAAGEDAFASLEDCRTLHVQAYAPGELQAMKLKPIRR
jgi:hypothetical protein